MPAAPRRRPSPDRCGFTLVELLVVVAIIVLLTSLMLVIVGKVKHVREITQCATNLRNVGIGAWSLAMDRAGALPEHHTGNDATFDTTMIRRDDEWFVNLGQVLGYVQQPHTLYCPSQDEQTSPSLAFNSAANPFGDGHPGQGHGQGQGQGQGQGNRPDFPPGLAKFNPPPGTNSSYPARSLLDPGPRPVAWAVRNYGNRVIYSDFVGVDGWVGQGRWKQQVQAPHASRGYNRLFGDGAVHWADAQSLHELRPINQQEPDATELRLYYERLDVMP